LARKDSRDEALRAACQFAQGDEPSRVVVESSDGTIAEAGTFGPDRGQEID
jgi:hypothetical protein